MINNITTNQVKLYKNSMLRTLYSMIYLLLIGLHLSCGVDKDGGGTAPSINYDPLGISSFSVVDSNDVPISDTNAIPLDALFLLTFDQSLGNMADYTNYLKGQIELLDMEDRLIDLNIQAEADQIKIIPTADLSNGITYQLTVKEGLTIGNYRVTNDITYPITTINYDPLGISSFSIVDSNDVPISDTNAIPLDASFLLTFDQSLENLDNHVNSLVNQIKLIDMGGGGGTPISLNIQSAHADQIKITPTTDLNYGITYQLTVKEGLTIGNYQVTHDITYLITTEKNSDSSLIVIYNNQEFFPSGNNITILLPIGSDPSSVSFTLEVGEGATLQDGNNNNLSLNENNQYPTNMDFSSSAIHSFTVTAQDGSTPVTYAIGISQQQMNSKEILSFAFQETDNSHLKANIAMDVNTNSQTVTKTVTNVEGITGLIPTIVHNGSNISPASGVAQDFSTNNTYIVTAIDKSTDDYTVTLTRYYGIIFNANGGLISGDPAVTEYVLYGEKTTPPLDPSQEHYGFNGWYDAPSGGNTFDFNTPITTQTIVYAQWTNVQYKVSFDTDGGSAIDPVMVNSLNPVARPVDPTTNHYVLESWYIDSSLTTRYDFSWVVSNDLTLYAKYIHKQYQVRFYQGANLLDTVSVVSLTTIPASDYPIPPISGKAYKWYSDNGLSKGYDISAQVTNNLILYADEIIVSFETIIEDGMIPVGLSSYGKMSEKIFSRYDAGATVVARYVKETATGNSDGSSWDNASGDIQAVINGINDASENKIYVVLAASGTYKPANSYVMKNHVALVGGFTSGSYDRSGETRLDGNNNKRVFNNDNNNLDSTALLYGVTITNGNSFYGGGMRNISSSPALINVIFSDNDANHGGGMYNSTSSTPTLNNVTFSGNIAHGSGGGMHNRGSSTPTLNNVTFSGNIAHLGGGMHNRSSSTPTLNNVTFSDNRADYGGGMHNTNSSSTLNNVTFSGNEAEIGGGIRNYFSSLILNNVDFLNNKADYGGGIANNNNSSGTLMDVDFSGNEANFGGGMYNTYSSSPILNNVDFSGNEADKGGGMHNSYSSSPILNNVDFLGNRAVVGQWGEGGGMFNWKSSPILSNVVFSSNTSDSGGGGMFNWRSSPTLSEVTFSDNGGEWGGGIYDRQSSTILINVTFSRNIADKDGGGLDNNHSSPTLINVTFSGNRSEDGGGMHSRGSSSPVLNNVTFSGNVVTETTGKGGGIYHNGDGQPLTLINTILWNNNNGQIYLVNDNSDIESVNFHYSLIEGGITPSTNATGIRLDDSDTIANPININSEEVIENDPGLGSLADNGGEVATISIDSSRPAKDKGVYLRGVKAGNTNTYSEADLYYSIDNANWHSDPDLTSSVPNLPNDADDLTATDARGYGRVGRPDMGAYEEGGTAP